MAEQNKTGLSPKTDTRKTEISKGILIFNRMGIWVITISLLIVGMIIAAANGGQFFSKSNIQSILEAVALYGMVAAGLFYVTYS